MTSWCNDGWENHHLSVAIIVENEYDETDRMVEVLFDSQCNTLQMGDNHFMIPWMILSQFRIKLDQLIEEWRLFTTQEEITINKLKEVLVKL